MTKALVALDKWSARIIAFCALGTCACFLGLGWQQLQIRGQASEGAKARERQQRVFPISLKVYVDAERRGVITTADLECFRTGRRCLRPTPTATP